MDINLKHKHKHRHSHSHRKSKCCCDNECVAKYQYDKVIYLNPECSKNLKKCPLPPNLLIVPRCKQDVVYFASMEQIVDAYRKVKSQGLCGPRPCATCYCDPCSCICNKCRHNPCTCYNYKFD
jgi:hypothetical protein